MAKFVTFCQGCNQKAEAPVHCRKCQSVYGVPNCDCGRQLRTIHIHACFRCTHTPQDVSTTATSIFEPHRWPSFPLPPMPGTTTIQRELPKAEGVKERPKEYVESWDYDGKKVTHTIHGFKRKQ